MRTMRTLLSHRRISSERPSNQESGGLVSSDVALSQIGKEVVLIH
jgi:hypothetical protein